MSSKSLYDVLGVRKADSCSEIKKAYLRLTKTHHPDKGGDPERFKEIAHAAEILTDEVKRRRYDETGLMDDSSHEMGGFGGGFTFPFEVNINDLFGNMFGSPPSGMGQGRGPIKKHKKPSPTTQTVGVTLEQFYMGHQFDLQIHRKSFCPSCDHSGAKRKEVCKACNGSGALTQVVQMGPMAMHTTGPCLECQTKGEKVLEACDKCTGTGFLQETRKLPVHILPGTCSQEVIVFAEVCSDHSQYERPGDVHILLTQDQNDPAYSFFTRTGDHQQHLEVKVTIRLAESLLGCVIRLDHHPGYEDGLFVQLPPASFQGDRYCASGFGMPLPGHVGKYGDLFLVIDVMCTPSDRALLGSKGRDLLTPLFQDKVRKTECEESAIQAKDVYLHK